MNEHLSKSLVQNYFDTFVQLLETGNSTDNIKEDLFYTKFFKFPIIK